MTDKIDYIKNINGLIEYFKNNNISQGAICLYLTIFNEFNKNYFINKLELKTKYLANINKISIKKVMRQINELQKHNLINCVFQHGKPSVFQLNKNIESYDKNDITQNKVMTKTTQLPMSILSTLPMTKTTQPTPNIYNNINNNLKNSLINSHKTRENISQYINIIIGECKDEKQIEYLKSIDIDLLLKAINDSDWLQDCQDIEFCIKNYNKAISGKYKTYKKDKQIIENKSNFIQNDYSNFDFNSLYDNLDEVKLT